MGDLETTIPVEALADLDVKEGDLLTVTRKTQGSVTLATTFRRGAIEMSGSQFVEKWGGVFDLEDLKRKAEDDPRLAHILEKHVS